MATLLLIETSTVNCSVAIAVDGQLIALKEQSAEHYVHAESLHVFIRTVLDQSGTSMDNLDAIAVSKGPGSYTGLRIGVASAKGLAFALNKPLIAIDTLEMLAHDASVEVADADFILPMIDARRMEAYLAVYNGRAELVTAADAVILSEQFFAAFGNQKLVLTGDGSAKCAEIAGSMCTLLNRMPSATMMAGLAEKAFQNKTFEDPAYFDPFYLKEYVPGVAKKSVL